MDHTIKLSVLFLQENDSWVGQCLEHDIAAQGKTLAIAKTCLEHTIAGQIFLDARSGLAPLSEIKAAPDFYKEKFNTAEQLKYQFQLSSIKPAYAIEDARLAVA